MAAARFVDRLCGMNVFQKQGFRLYGVLLVQ
jgi:hypothetical protein